jgi:hypothetical protein
MKNSAYLLASSISKIQKHHIQFFVLTITVVMLVLGAGAPADFGDHSIR